MKWTIIPKEYPPAERHKIIFDKFDEIAAGDSIELQTDHPPIPLQLQFENQKENCFSWTTTQKDGLWFTTIVKMKAESNAKKKTGCCGCC